MVKIVSYYNDNEKVEVHFSIRALNNKKFLSLKIICLCLEENTSPRFKQPPPKFVGTVLILLISFSL